MTTLVVALALLAGLIAAALVALDPYDTGRFTLFPSHGVGAGEGPRTANASRGRDPRFDSAVFGNSHVQLLAPERLNARAGGAWVSLIAPATGPKEQLVLLDWFVRHRRAPARAIVIGVDANWCVNDPAMPNEKPFPFWLYDRSGARYVAGLFRAAAIADLGSRLQRLVGKGKRAREDGWWDYEPEYLRLRYDAPERRAALDRIDDLYASVGAGPFPAVAALERALAGARQTPVVLLRPPLYPSVRPQTAAGAAASRACGEALADLAARRPRTRLIDWQAGPGADDPANFFDRTHYRRPLAERLEAAIAAALAELS
ncbi:MAG: hypothetical protein JNK46_01190 [Methylobacteriaceae bacterium]|nr:hypothetical protein [Methylobacteriaceae bacterium]